MNVSEVERREQFLKPGAFLDFDSEGWIIRKLQDERRWLLFESLPNVVERHRQIELGAVLCRGRSRSPGR